MFSYLRTLKTWHCSHLMAPVVQQSIDISYPPDPQQQTRRTLLQRANGGQTDGRTDGHRAVS